MQSDAETIGPLIEGERGAARLGDIGDDGKADAAAGAGRIESRAAA
jgi:hypothetical protein